MRTKPNILVALALFAACGDTQSAPDAALAPGLETMSVIFDPGFIGLVAFSSEASGELIDTGTVAANGKVSLDVRPGGMISLEAGNAGLISILNVDPSADLVWQAPPPLASPARSLMVSSSNNLGATRYQVAACQDQTQSRQSPFSTELNLSSECIAEAELSVLSIAANNTGLMAYEHASLRVADELDAVHEITWQTDFEEVALDPFIPLLAYAAEVAPKLAFGNLSVELPLQDFDLDKRSFDKPPIASEIMWTRVVAYSGGRGWQEYAGPLSTAASDWLGFPNGMVIQHSADVDPHIRWLPTDQGDYQSIFCFWEVDAEYGFWQVIAAPDENLAIYPELPAQLQGSMHLGIEPTAPTLGQLEIVDYTDIEGYAAATNAGRISWAITPPLRDQHLDEGGAIASTMTFSD